MPQPLTRAAVESALAEYRKLGGKAFRKKYGFGGARDYFLVVGGENFDSKAIVGAAYGFLPGGRPLGLKEFSGGLADAAGKLVALGYEVLTPGQNADWSWEEHVLALNFYFDHRDAIPDKKSEPIRELSQLLKTLGTRTGVAMTAKFRNENGVYMKMMNFRRLDPEFTLQGKSGLTQGSGLEQQVWAAYANDRALLHGHAESLASAIGDASLSLAITPDDVEEYEGEEGGVLLKLHRSRERDPKLIRKKKAKVLAQTGRLKCEACDLEFGQCYGPHGEGYIEVHHLEPVSARGVRGGKTYLSDLAVVCANCHRMLHRGKKLLTLTELKACLADSRATGS